jgi:hypothetical protein
MIQNEEYKDIAKEIVNAVNETTNDYDAIEQVEQILISLEEEE